MLFIKCGWSECFRQSDHVLFNLSFMIYYEYARIRTEYYFIVVKYIIFLMM